MGRYILLTSSGKNCIQSMSKLPEEAFTIFAGMVMTEMEPKGLYAALDGGLRVFLPKKELDSSPLYVPDLIREMSGGKLTYVPQPRKSRRASEGNHIPDADHTNHNMMKVMEGSDPSH